MVFLEELLTPLASLLHVPVGVLVFASLMVMGVFGHYAIYRMSQADHSRRSHRNPVGRCGAVRHLPAHSMGDVGGARLLSLSLFRLDGIREALLAVV
ncbi:MAG: hypothetical protein CM15mP103_10100 [Gammaproteobacteria bacterium]|nr:MAG: hypothetical protein CM15mP103_10100 [Gammaproteobacteria bacterium]